ncbi:unnamed protein product, partial [Phaeothamnion confervicola]
PRAIAAAVLAGVAVAATWSGASTFAALVLAIAVVMSWEWSRIVRGASYDAALLVHAVSTAAAVILAARGAAPAGVLVSLIGAAGVLFLAPTERAGLSALGVVYTGLPAVAFVWLRGGDAFGVLAILFIFTIVWTTDTFAYLCGRLIGGPKLWPALSPGKTWSGTAGGVLFAALAGALFAGLLVRPNPLALALIAVLLS